MELRRILYGYRKEQFEFYVVSEEAVIVRRIFNEYIGGRTLKDIAELLQGHQTLEEYHLQGIRLLDCLQSQ